MLSFIAEELEESESVDRALLFIETAELWLAKACGEQAGGAVYTVSLPA